MGVVHAEELTSNELAQLVGPSTIAVLPVAAIEPHGPHLPLSTDSDIARGHLAHLPDYLAPELDVLVLPLQAIGLSIEHAGFAGVFSHRPETLLTVWDDVVAPFRALGGRKLVVVSSHGGNSEVAGLFVQRLAVEHAMLAVTAAWLRFGQPQGAFAEDEIAHGIHGGDVETSLMLHYWPEAVRMEARQDFASMARHWQGRQLSAHGRNRLAWISAGLNPEGAVGNALAASAEKGALSAHHALTGFAELLADVAELDPDALLGGSR